MALREPLLSEAMSEGWSWRRVRRGMVVLVGAAVILGCGEAGPPSITQGPGGPTLAEVDLPDPIERDLPAMVEDEQLRVCFAYNSTGYFIYRGEVMGFEFRTLRAFAKDRGMDIAPVVVRDRSQSFVKLNEGECDVVAARLLRSDSADGEVAFTQGLYRTRAVVVQRSGPPEDGLDGLSDRVEEIVEGPEPDIDLGPLEVDARLITRPSQLSGERVHVPVASPYVERLLEVSNLVTGDIEIIEVRDETSLEGLVQKISSGEIELTVGPENVAELQEEYYTNVTVMPRISAPEPVVWAVRRNAPELLGALDEWIDANGAAVEEEYRIYFEDREQFRERVASEYLTTETGRLSRYDDLIKEHAKKIGWDWRLLAAQTFQESRFNPTARSWAGAVGLLQLMPATAREVGVRNSRDPEQNVAGAVRYLEWLDEQWQTHEEDWHNISDPEERKRFVLASYNAGRGHVLDAQRLARKHGDDPREWDEVAYWLLQKSKRQYYNDPVVFYGFARGLEPVTYVALIFERYSHYLDFVTS